MSNCPEEVILSQQVGAGAAFLWIDGVYVGVGRIDNLIGHPPCVVLVFLVVYVLVLVRLGEGVL